MPLTAAAPAPGAATARRAARPALILFLACVAQFMLLVDDTIVNVALPTIAADLGLGESSLSWVVNAYLLTFGGFLLVGGRLADRFGPRRMFALSLAGFAVASAVCGLAPSSGVLVGARAAQGVMGALLSPAALAIVLATYRPGPARTKALSVWTALMGLGAATGLVAGGVLTEVASWRWNFLVNLPVAILALAAVPRVLPVLERHDRRPLPNVAGASLATLALLTLVFTVVETDDHAWTSGRTLGGLAVAALLAVGFAISERGAASPLLPTELLRRRRGMSADLVVFIAAGGLLAMFFFQTLYLQRVLGRSALEAGLSFLPFSATMLVGSGVAMKVPHTMDSRIPIVVGLLLGAGGLWLMSTLGPDSAYAGHVLPAMMIVAGGLGLALVPVMAVATGDAQERDGGLASGLMTSAQQIGGAIGIAVLVTVASERATAVLAGGGAEALALSEGFQRAFHVQTALMVAAAFVAAWLLRPDRRVERPVAPG